MIDEKVAKSLEKLHPRNKTPGCIFIGNVVVISSPMLILEIPKDELGASFTGTPVGEVRQWRYRFLPQGTVGELAQPVRTAWTDDEGNELEVIQLLSDNLTSHVSADLYDWLDENVEGLEYHLYPGERPDGAPHAVGLYRGQELVGAIAPLVRREDAEPHGWMEL